MSGESSRAKQILRFAQDDVVKHAQDDTVKDDYLALPSQGEGGRPPRAPADESARTGAAGAFQKPAACDAWLAVSFPKKSALKIIRNDAVG
jgi:hypothetical protein